MNIHTTLTFPHPDGAAIKGAMHWHDKDPLAVSLRFTRGVREPVEWWISRDLLFHGACYQAGDGDIRVTREKGGHVRIEFNTPTGYASLVTALEPLGSFLIRTYTCVPQGQERIDIDGWLNQLMNKGAA